MDENILSGILERIRKIKEEIDALENEVIDMMDRQSGIPAQEDIEPVAEDLSEEPIDLSISIPEITVEDSPEADNYVPDIPEDLPESDEIASETDTEIDIVNDTVIEAEAEAETEPEPVPQPEQTPKPEGSETQPQPEPVPDIIAETETATAKDVPEEKTHRKKTVLEAETAEKAVLDVLEHKEAWRTDRPGFPVKNIISAISLNDRLLLINALFREDPVLFQDTIARFNAMASLQEAIDYIHENFSDWNLNSEPVYRLIMAVRRKLK